MTIVRRLLKLALKSLTPIMVNTLVTRLSHAAAPFIVQVAERLAIATIDFAGMHEFDKDNLTKALKNAGDHLSAHLVPLAVVVLRPERARAIRARHGQWLNLSPVLLETRWPALMREVVE